MLIYKQLGPAAEQEFAKVRPCFDTSVHAFLGTHAFAAARPAQTWGVGYALDNASEWQDVLKTAVQAALVVVVLDALRLSRSSSWCVAGVCVCSRVL